MPAIAPSAPAHEAAPIAPAQAAPGVEDRPAPTGEARPAWDKVRMPARPAAAGPRRSSRALVMVGAVSVALVSTASAYLAMVGFGVDLLAMSPPVAYATAGVFELSLMTVALLAREAAKGNRPAGTLLALTWVLSGASGLFAAWHELVVGHPAGAAVFRLTVPLLAALMWHLALIGDQHLASGRTWSELRAGRRMHALFQAIEAERRARVLDDGSRRARRHALRAEARRLRARSLALRSVPPEQMREVTAAWTDAFAALEAGAVAVLARFDDGAARMTAEPHAAKATRRSTSTPAREARPTEAHPAPARPAPTPRPAGGDREALRAEVERLAGEGLSHREIADQLGGVTKSTVGRWLA
ncbi:helix-turn-helix domain-containing protein [Isoptericola dokdonensis]|uniref:Uncharacterized protein n=1 Tax=Isoptericola dokdonensis DS-3 TaxID=1300344 RepID=A0A161II24_9MICO|nr:helix-turn-helix domain-containing protein [Isoptericola dokdonensis]ANC31454.1 hypothetical protein I598_1906 [Isoptericola dokdonensis DS-3]